MGWSRKGDLAPRDTTPRPDTSVVIESPPDPDDVARARDLAEMLHAAAILLDCRVDDGLGDLLRAYIPQWESEQDALNRKIERAS